MEQGEITLRKNLRAVLTAVGAATIVLVSGAAASAETTAYGELFDYSGAWVSTQKCVNSVVMGRSNGQIYAYGITKCGGNKSSLHPEASLAGNGGQNGMEGKNAVCFNVSYCESPRVYLQEISGVTYRSTNAGTVAGDFMPPDENALAHAQVIGGRSNRAGSEAGSGRVRWADFDGDGRADYWIVNPSGSVNVYLNKGGDGHGGWQDMGQVASGLTTDSTRVRFADFNGDGKADYLLINPSGSVNVYLNNGGDGHGGWQGLNTVTSGLTSDASRVRFTDIDGDGRTDYNVINPNGSITTYLNRGGDTSGGWTDYGQIAGGLTGDLTRIRLADINGEGRADYNVINPNGSITTYLNNGGDGHGGWTNYGQAATGTTTNQNAVTLTDFTGDGRADYLVTNPDGSVNAYANNGGDGHGGWTDLGRIAAGA
ncbi:VCBS repeat-containing protein [Kitasatospora camelliae]|uniref:VCBS repeat-containing protein n=1 Tax=Kitasatospora camelliae TaxID=3156397 RepID=A0AAU8K5V0_9ACTN